MQYAWLYTRSEYSWTRALNCGLVGKALIAFREELFVFAIQLTFILLDRIFDNFLSVERKIGRPWSNDVTPKGYSE
jgi:hypothetical protein